MFHSGNPPLTYVSRVSTTNPASVEAGQPVANCQSASATFVIDANDWRHIACLHGAPAKVHVVSTDPTMQNQATVAVFSPQSAPGDWWSSPPR